MMEQLLTLSGNRKRYVRDIVVEMLSQEWPLSAKKIYSMLRNKYHLDVSYQAVHKALKELLKQQTLIRKGKLYEINKSWIESVKSDIERLENTYEIKSSQSPRITGKIKIYNSADDFYKNLIRMCKENEFLRLSSKTPAMILSKEADMTIYRKEYVKLLFKRVKENKLKVHYLFSTELTKERIIKEKDKNAILRIKRALNMPNLKLKHAPLYSVITLAIARDEYMIGFASPHHADQVGVMHVMADNTRDISSIYDNIFSNALEVNEFIKDIEKSLNPASIH